MFLWSRVQQKVGKAKRGNVLEAVSDDFVCLSAYDIYICGRFEMAGAAREQFSAEEGCRARAYVRRCVFVYITRCGPMV